MKTKKYFSKIRGFTLVELMVVISIIALLTGMLMVNFTKSKARSRDARRVSDLNQIQLALEQYFDRCGQYPATFATTANNGCVGLSPAITLASYISKIPVPPSIQTTYDYAVNSTTYPTDYVLHATLEYNNAAQQNSLTPIPGTVATLVTPGTLFSCGDSTTLDYCIGSK